MCRAAVAAMNVHCVASKIRAHFFGQVEDSHIQDAFAAVLTLAFFEREVLAEFDSHSPTPFIALKSLNAAEKFQPSGVHAFRPAAHTVRPVKRAGIVEVVLENTVYTVAANMTKRT